MRQYRLVISGHVQGVFFRATTCEQANDLGLHGWVRNRPDGTVEAEVGGDADDLGSFLVFCAKGPERARVDHLSLEPITRDSLPCPFEVQR